MVFDLDMAFDVDIFDFEFSFDIDSFSLFGSAIFLATFSLNWAIFFSQSSGHTVYPPSQKVAKIQSYHKCCSL